jgi:SRSO17 transposase
MGSGDDVGAYVTEALGNPEAVLVVDKTGDLKKGVQSVGCNASTARMGEQDVLGLGLTLASTGFVPHL